MSDEQSVEAFHALCDTWLQPQRVGQPPPSDKWVVHDLHQQFGWDERTIRGAIWFLRAVIDYGKSHQGQFFPNDSAWAQYVAEHPQLATYRVTWRRARNWHSLAKEWADQHPLSPVDEQSLLTTPHEISLVRTANRLASRLDHPGWRFVAEDAWWGIASNPPDQGRASLAYWKALATQWIGEPTIQGLFAHTSDSPLDIAWNAYQQLRTAYLDQVILVVTQAEQQAAAYQARFLPPEQLPLHMGTTRWGWNPVPVLEYAADQAFGVSLESKWTADERFAPHYSDTHLRAQGLHAWITLHAVSALAGGSTENRQAAVTAHQSWIEEWMIRPELALMVQYHQELAAARVQCRTALLAVSVHDLREGVCRLCVVE